MKSLLVLARILAELVFLTAVVLALGLVALWLLQRSGRLEDEVVRGIAKQLGPLCTKVELDEAQLDYFAPALTLRGLRLELVGGHLSLDTLRLPLPPWSEQRFEPLALEASTGSLEASRELLEALGSRSREPATPKPGGLEYVILRELQLAWRDADGRVLPLGRLEGVLRGPTGPSWSVDGEFLPSTAPGRGAQELPQGAPVRFHAEALPSGGIALAAGARDALVDSRALAALLGRAPALGEPQGLAHVSLAASAHLDGQEQRAELRLEAREMSLSLQLAGAGEQRLEQGTLQLSWEARAPALEGLLSLERCQAQAQLSGSWNQIPIEVRAALGPGAGAGGGLRVALRAERLPLERTLLERLGVAEVAGDDFDALGLAGETKLVLGLDWRRSSPAATLLETLRQTPRIAARASLEGRTQFCFHGWLEPDGLQRGFPLQAEQVRGAVLVGLQLAAERPTSIGLFGIEARVRDGTEDTVEPGKASARCSGTLFSPRTGVRPELDLELELEGLALSAPAGCDDALEEPPSEIQRALARMPETDSIWPDYAPRAGLAKVHWRMVMAADYHGLVHAADIEVRDSCARWSGLPLRVGNLNGALRLRWDTAADWIPPPDSLQYATRAFGISFAFEGKLNTAGKTTVVGAARNGPLLSPSAAAPGERGTPALQVAVDIDRLALTGADVRALREFEPSLVESVDAFGPRGFVDLHWCGGQALPAGPYRFDLAAVPREAVLQPLELNIVLEQVRGRVLVSGERAPPSASAARAPEQERIELRAALQARSRVGMLAAVAARIEAGSADHLPGRSQAQVYAAGVDPSNPSVLGAFREFAGRRQSDGSGSGADLSLLQISGALDLSAEFAIGAQASAGEDSRDLFRVHLRGNDLGIGDLLLTDLQGVLVHSQGVLESQRVLGNLAGTQIVLDHPRLIASADIARLAPEQASFARDPSGTPASYLLLSGLEARELPIDREHLSAFVDSASLQQVLERFQWSGTLDLERASLAVAGGPNGKPKLRVEGDLKPKAMHLDFGLPLLVESAAVRLREIVFEAGRMRGWAEVSALDADLADRHIANGALILSYVDGRLSIDDLSCEFEGGQLSSPGGAVGANAFAMDFAPPYRFALALELEQVDVSGLLRGLFESSLADQGRLDARLRLTGQPDKVLGLQGSGVLELSDARLWSIPVMRDLFSQLGQDSTAVFNEMRMRWELREGVLRMQPIRLRSPLLRLEGQGSLSLDGALEHELEVRYALVDRLGPFKQLLYWLQNSLLRVSIRGDMARPAVLLRNSLVDLFKRSVDNSRHLPIPELAPILPRF